MQDKRLRTVNGQKSTERTCWENNTVFIAFLPYKNYFLGAGRRCSGAGPVERSGWKLVHFGYSEKQIGNNLFASLYGHVPFTLISVDYCESTHPLP